MKFIKRLLDYRLIFVIIINELCCLFPVQIFLFIIFGLARLTENLPLRDHITAIYLLTIVLPIVILVLLAGLLIRRIDVWLVSLPLQFSLYFVSLDSKSIVSLDSESIALRAEFIGMLLLFQFLGVIVGFLVRKIKAKRSYTI